MPPDAAERLKPRKLPRQARAVATVEAIYEAAIQVLVADDGAPFSTTTVAARAGVSVGSMYQYFPHKQALLHALSAHHLDAVAEQVEAACTAARGRTLAEMIEALIAVYWDAKVTPQAVTRAIYRSTQEFDSRPVMTGFRTRMTAAALSLFGTASDREALDLALVRAVLLPVIFGTVRDFCERPPARGERARLRTELTRMCLAWLEAARRPDRLQTWSG